jgi:arsenate reductase
MGRLPLENGGNDNARNRGLCKGWCRRVCDNAANEVCPIWPGQPMTAHWGVPDPAAVKGTETEIATAFRDAFLMLQRRIELFANLPVKSLDRMSLKKRLDEIGKTTDEKAQA